MKKEDVDCLWSDEEDDIFFSPTKPVVKNNVNKQRKLDTFTSQIPAQISTVKSNASWVASAFDGFDDFEAPVVKSCTAGKQTLLSQSSDSFQRKRPRETSTKTRGHSFMSQRSAITRRKNVSDNDLWADKHAPLSKNDLAVHKKKIEEVENWLLNNLKRKPHQGAPVLLLTGPAGAGKTATMNVLSQEHNIEIQEWVNPLVTQFEEIAFNREDYVPVEGPTHNSQVTVFRDFLLRANKYQTLQIFGGDRCHSRKIVLVEDFPNFFYRQSKDFHEILRKYVSTGHCPLVFIISDSAGGESNERHLFPKDLQSQLNIYNISFNPVAPTSMVKVLQRIATTESTKGAHKFSVPSKSTLEAIANASSGDIRGAVNALQFACLRDTADLASIMRSSCKDKKKSEQSSKSKSKSAKSKQTKGTSNAGDEEETDLAAIGGKDTSLFLFRALGKILHCKRDPDSSDALLLPPHLAQYSRHDLLLNPEVVIERSNLSGDFFTAYLQQNYVDFYSDIDDVVRASEYISDCDFLTSDWVSRTSQGLYAASVAARGIMFSNSARAGSTSTGGSGLGWKPLHKPQWFASAKKARENSLAARTLFKGHSWTPEDLQTQYLPYLSLTSVPLHDPGQFTFLQDLCKYSLSKFSSRSYPERLDEKDVEMDVDNEEPSLAVQDVPHLNKRVLREEEDDIDIPSSQSNLQVGGAAEEQEEEEVVIEDFDD
ncbi:cell cycle checkpoint protein RAD17 isoform X1 [Lingula anatina]|uniref:Cell cycle checkpoint protein RAD17 isoform X1 n=1 Tax=Lingula anatina TaxID=7574 RepID=A0A1S3KA59_LINAN|nr:cell cycle checkpoint protein RAD17 isoform X1 [Lingula anatina]|eukprot:XP_013419387.1 cell cycle checkpoint protein RAD17 isoform X1 [Lingula anatina]